MPRLKCIVEYDGTHFVGWQRQLNGRSVQEAIEQAIAYCDGNIPKAAAMLEVSPSTIYRKRQIWEVQKKA